MQSLHVVRPQRRDVEHVTGLQRHLHGHGPRGTVRGELLGPFTVHTVHGGSDDRRRGSVQVEAGARGGREENNALLAVELDQGVVHGVVMGPQPETAAGAPKHGAEVLIVVQGSAPQYVGGDLKLLRQTGKLVEAVRGLLAGIATDASQVVPRLLLLVGPFRLGLGGEFIEELPERHVLEPKVLSNKVQVRGVRHVNAHL